MEEKEKIYAVKVGGQTVPTWQLFWDQMMAQSCRIDRSNTIAWIAVAVAVFDTVALVALVISGC